MGVEVFVALVTAIAGLMSVVLALYRRVRDLKYESESEPIMMEIGDIKIEIPRNTSDEDVKHLLELVRKNKVSEIKKKVRHATSSQAGSVAIDILLLIVPGIIALLFAGTFIYLLVANQNVPNYTT